MNRRDSGQLRFTTTDLTNYLRCAELSHLDYQSEVGTLQKQSFRAEARSLIHRASSDRAEQYLHDLLPQGHEIVHIEDRDVSQADRAAATLAAMRAGADVIYRPVFITGVWSGGVDFLFRVNDSVSDLGNWSYEVLAVAAPASAMELTPVEALELADASAHVAALQGHEPESAHFAVRAGRVRTVALRDVAPWFRAVRAVFEELVASAAPVEEVTGSVTSSSIPAVVPHCADCDWLLHCESVRGEGGRVGVEEPRPHLHPSQFAPILFPKERAVPLTLSTSESYELGLDLEALVPEFHADRDSDQQALWTLAQLLACHIEDDASSGLSPDARQPLEQSMVWLAKAAMRGRLAGVARVSPLAAALLQRTGQSASSGLGRPQDADVAAWDVAETAARRRARTLSNNFMTICGPPGSGKTTTAAKIACDLAERGDRVGITAPTEALMLNLLRAVRNESQARGQVLRFGTTSFNSAAFASEVATADNDFADTRHFDNVSLLDAAVTDGTIDVAACAPEYFARESTRAMYTSLLVDEAGQLTLTRAVAMTPATRNLILAGTPDCGPGHDTADADLFNPRQTVLTHLGGNSPVAFGKTGVILPAVRRMHPAIANFVADQFLNAPITMDPDAGRQWLSPAGIGLRFDRVTSSSHDGDGSTSFASELEDRVTQAVAELVGQQWTAADGLTRPLGLSDIFVISPDPEQVAALRRAIGTAVRVGGVHEFAGEHAPVVICALPASGDSVGFTAEDLCAIITRAQGLAVMIGPDDLLSTNVADVGELARTSALLRLVEVAAFSTDVQSEINELISGAVTGDRRTEY